MWPEWTSMLSPAGWAALAVVPAALVALYFLKLRRQPLEVPSTYLWLKSIEDLRVNSLWQRLRHSILLFLQLALVVLLIIALGRPSWSGQRLVGGRSIFLIDNSASMAATDVAPSRLAEAKRRVGELIDDMDSGDVAMLISFSDTAQVAQSFTNSRQELRRALEAIPQTDHRTDLAEALNVASGLAAPGQATLEESAAPDEAMPARMYIFSDGKFADVENFSLAKLAPVFVPITGSEARNVGIVALGTQRRDDHPEQMQVFARIENFSAEPASLDASLYLDSELIDAEHLDLKARASGGVAFDLGEVQAGVLELRLAVDDAAEVDKLAIDNRAWTTINPPRPMQVLLVTQGDEPLAVGLRTERARQLADLRIEPPSFLDAKEYATSAAAGVWDLIIYDRCRPAKSPRANTFTIDALPPVEGWNSAAEVSAPQILDADSAHPLMQTVNLGDVLIAAATPLTVPRGGHVLIDTTSGPLLAIAPREEFEDVVLACPIMAPDGIGTNWPVRLSWPVFLLNMLEYFGSQRDALTTGATQPGELVELRLETPAATIEVVPPGEKGVTVPRKAENLFPFTGTQRVGVYEVRADHATAGRFAVNLLDRDESDIRPREGREIQVGHVKIEGQSGWEAVRREGWKLLVLAALAILLIEWYIYNRRVYV